MPLERQERALALILGDALAAVGDADLRALAEPARRHDHPLPCGRVPHGVGEQVHEHALQQHRIRAQTRQCRIQGELDVGGTERQLVERRDHAAPRVHPGERHCQDPCLHAADIEQVRHEAGQGGEALVGGLDELGTVLRRQAVRAAEPADRGDGGCERPAQVMTERGEQGAAHLVGLGEHRRLARGLAQIRVLDRRGELGDDRVEQAAACGVEIGPVQFEDRARAAVGAHADRHGLDLRPGHRGRPGSCRRGFAGRGVGRILPVGVLGERLPIGGDHRAVGGEQPDAAQPERLARPRDQGRGGAVAAQHVARHGGEELGLSGGALGGTGAPGGLVHDDAHEHRDHDVQHEREGVQRIRDRHREERFDEEEIERDAAQHRGEQGGAEPADEGDHDDEQLVAQHVARDGSRRLEREQQPREQRPSDQGHGEADQLAPPPEGSAADRRERSAAAGRGMRDDVHVDVAGTADDLRADARPGERRGEAGAPAHADHELARVNGLRELHQRAGHVVADELVVAAAERFHEAALGAERPWAVAAQPVLGGDVHGQQLAAGRARGDPRAAAQQGLAFRAAGEGDDHALAGLPGAVDAVLRAVAAQRAVHLVCQPQQRQFTQGGEVAEAEVVRQGGVDPLGRIHLARREAVAQGLRGEIHDLHLVGPADHRIRHGLLLHDPGDLLDHGIERLDVLHVHGRDDVDARVQQLLHVLPALRVAGSWRVGVRHLVDEGERGPAREHRVDVEFVELHPAMRHGPARHLLDAPGLRERRIAAVRLHDPDDHVAAGLGQAAPFAEHLVGLAHARRRAEQHAQPAAGSGSALAPRAHHRLAHCTCPLVAASHRCRASRAWFSASTFTRSSPRNPASRV